MRATAKDLRFHSKELLDAVARGETVVITYRGKACAKLVPLEKTDEDQKAADIQLFGIWKDHEGVVDVNGYVRNLRRSRSNAR